MGWKICWLTFHYFEVFSSLKIHSKDWKESYKGKKTSKNPIFPSVWLPLLDELEVVGFNIVVVDELNWNITNLSLFGVCEGVRITLFLWTFFIIYSMIEVIFASQRVKSPFYLWCQLIVADEIKQATDNELSLSVYLKGVIGVNCFHSKRVYNLKLTTT